MASRPVHALLFDLGGVLIELDFERMYRAWARHSPLSPEEIAARFSVDSAYERHERGEINAADYFEHLRRLLQLKASDREVAEGWNALFVGPIEESLALVRRLRTTIPCFCFTNTNPTHQRTWSSRYPELGSLFEEIFASSSIGLRKPDERAFRTVAERMGVEPTRILFFDDLAQNVDAARAVGMQAVTVRSPRDIIKALELSRVQSAATMTPERH